MTRAGKVGITDTCEPKREDSEMVTKLMFWWSDGLYWVSGKLLQKSVYWSRKALGRKYPSSIE